MSEDQNYKGPVQKTQWRSRTSCRKFWWLDNSRSQGSQWTLGISKQSSIRSRGSLVEYYPISAKDQSRIHQLGKKVLPGLFLGYALFAWEFGRVTLWLQTLRSWRRWTHRKSTRKDSMRERWYFPKKKENLFFQSQMDESNFLEEIRTWEHPPWHGNVKFEEKVT